MWDVVFAYVYDFGSGRNGRPSGGSVRSSTVARSRARRRGPDPEILAFEGTTSATIAASVAAVEPLARRLRVMGSLALSLCHLAAGRVDAVCSLKGARSVDIAAAQLLVRERGLAIDLPESPPFGTRHSISSSGHASWLPPRLACARLSAALGSATR